MSLKTTYIGHATNLIQWNHLNVLTDPLFSNRVLFFKRKQPLPFDPSQLPPLDAILISHAHYDHLDCFSFKYIASDVPIFVPEGMTKALAPFVKNPIIELTTWGHFKIKDSLEIIAVPAKHPGGRFLLPLRYRTCHGYILSYKGEQIYFAGDTSDGEHFTTIASLFSIRLALLPLAIMSNDILRRRRHLSIPDFLKVWEVLSKPHVIPIHWGCFFRTWKTKEALLEAIEKQIHPDSAFKDKLHLLSPGETWSI